MAAEPFRDGRRGGSGACSSSQPLAWRRQVRNGCTGSSGRASRGLLVVCMANQRRVARVAKQIERELGVLLQGDQVLQNAICPEHRVGYDSSLSALASVTEVQLSSDLQVAKVYLSVYSDQEGRDTALKGLSRLQGYVRTRLANQMQLRMVPEIRFIHDEAAERGEEVLALLEAIKRQDAGEEERPPVVLPPLPEERQAGASSSSSGVRQGGRGAEEEQEDGFLNLEEDEEEGFLVDDFRADALGFLPEEEEELFSGAAVGRSAAGVSLTEYELKYDGEVPDDSGRGSSRRQGGQRQKRKQHSKRR